jgi:hypothetical protein
MICHRHEVPHESEVDVDRRGVVHTRMIIADPALK